MSRFTALAVLALLGVGCRTKEEVPLDLDLDGVTEDLDCDDGDASVYPGADEVCDGVDNDCDGEVDEGAVDAPVWYADADGDGYGGPESEAACEAPRGTTDVGGDCDDAASTVFPGADEFCNGVDDDCDGEVDEDPVDPLTWYLDEDGDGWGDEDLVAEDCAAPEGYVADPGDCDDADARYHPGAVEEDCTDPEDYNCDGSVGWADDDGDGYAACEECDDADRAVNPSATEICDGVDNDCNGTVDTAEAVDASTWYADTDGDGYGDAGVSTEDCEQPSGYVADDSDCDDASDASYPGADEVCDEADNDCDGTVDEEATDAPTWYRDADGDGYGDAEVTTAACEQPSGYVADATDCDDLAAGSYPGADEVCDGEDNDCDGTVDEDDATDAATWYADADGDGYGDADDIAVACDAPSGYVADDSDCDDADAAEYPGADETCDGDDDDCDGTVDEDTAVDAATWYLDADEDGYGDAGRTTVACAAPSGYVDDDTDCDDLEATTYPGADETCDDEDDDCDGTVDDSPVDEPTWYADADGDGYGDVDTSTDACDAPSGYLSDATDCDDTDAGTYPGAPEYCDFHDEDCDGVDDNDPVDGDLWFEDADGDGYGDVGSWQEECDQPSGYVADGTDCDDADADVSPGGTEVCNGVDDDCDGDTDEDEEVLGEAEDCAADSCEDVLDARDSTPSDGALWIDPTGSSAYEAYCEFTTDGGGWTLLAIFTNGDSSINWDPSDSGWVGTTDFGDAADPSTNADARSPAWSDLPVDEVLIVHWPDTVGVQTDTGCVDGDTLLDFMSVDSELDTDCAHACATVDLGGDWTGQSRQDSTLRFRCRDYNGGTITDGGGFLVSQDDNSMITTMIGGSSYYDYNFGLGAGYLWPGSYSHADWDRTTTDSGDDSDTTQVLLYGR